MPGHHHLVDWASTFGEVERSLGDFNEQVEGGGEIDQNSRMNLDQHLDLVHASVVAYKGYAARDRSV